MDELANERLFNNYFLTAHIYYTPEDVKDASKDIFPEIAEQVRAVFKDTPYGLYKIHTLSLFFHSTDGLDLFSAEFDSSVNNTGPVPSQPEDVKNAQTVAFNFVKDFNSAEFGEDTFSHHGEVFLRRFGIKASKSELYVEIPITSVPKYTADSANNAEVFKASLSDRGTELRDLLINDADTKKYLVDNNVTKITIAFFTMWEPLGELYHTFSFDFAK